MPAKSRAKKAPKRPKRAPHDNDVRRFSTRRSLSHVPTRTVHKVSLQAHGQEANYCSAKSLLQQIRGVGRQFNSQKNLSDSKEVQLVAARLGTPWTFPHTSLHGKQRNVCEHSSKALHHGRLKKDCPAIAAQSLLETRATRHLLPSNQCAVDKRASGAEGGMAWL